jgi:hypothetical protein
MVLVQQGKRLCQVFVFQQCNWELLRPASSRSIIFFCRVSSSAGLGGMFTQGCHDCEHGGQAYAGQDLLFWIKESPLVTLFPKYVI